MCVLKFLSFFSILFTIYSIFLLYFGHLNGIIVIKQDKLAAIEQHGELGSGFHLAQKDMGIRGFGNVFGEQQTGDIGNVGTDLFFEMLFESLSKVKKDPPTSPPLPEKRKEQRDMRARVHTHSPLHKEK